MRYGSLVLGLAAILIPFGSTGSPVSTLLLRPVGDFRNARPGLSLDEAVRQVQRDTGGRVLAADVVPGSGGVTYRIKVLLPSGRVKVIYVDPRR